jgi:hypothetical protein
MGDRIASSASVGTPPAFWRNSTRVAMSEPRAWRTLRSTTRALGSGMVAETSTMSGVASRMAWTARRPGGHDRDPVAELAQDLSHGLGIGGVLVEDHRMAEGGGTGRQHRASATARSARCW